MDLDTAGQCVKSRITSGLDAKTALPHLCSRRVEDRLRELASSGYVEPSCLSWEVGTLSTLIDAHSIPICTATAVRRTVHLPLSLHPHVHIQLDNAKWTPLSC